MLYADEINCRHCGRSLYMHHLSIWRRRVSMQRSHCYQILHTNAPDTQTAQSTLWIGYAAVIARKNRELMERVLNYVEPQ